MDTNTLLPTFLHTQDNEDKKVNSLGDGIIPLEKTKTDSTSFVYKDQERFNHSGSPKNDPASNY